MRPSVSQEFAERAFVRVERFISPALARTQCARAFDMLQRGEMRRGDAMVPGTPARYGAPEMDALLKRLRPKVEAATSLRLYPSYSYLRIYNRGDQLAAHVDRPACEVSVSLMLGQEAARPWPLWVEARGNRYAASLRPGDALIYRGMECRHWRHTFRGSWQCQLFLHFVDRDGPHASWKFDRRPRLGLPVERRR